MLSAPGIKITVPRRSAKHCPAKPPADEMRNAAPGLACLRYGEGAGSKTRYVLLYGDPNNDAKTKLAHTFSMR